MKKYLLVLLCTLFVQVAFAQDVILKVNGEELNVNVLEITPINVIYQSPDSVTGKHYSLAKTDIFMIRYANGTKEVFQENEITQEVNDSVTYNPDEMYRLGQNDAMSLYKGNGALVGSAVASFFFGYGLIGSAVIGDVRPKATANKAIPEVYLQDVHYVRGYENKAHKRKVGKVVSGASIGTAAIITVLLAAINSAY